MEVIQGTWYVFFHKIKTFMNREIIKWNFSFSDPHPKGAMMCLL